MKCPKCGHPEDKVIDSRIAREGASVRRRRECLSCAWRFTTLEEIVPAEIIVVKRDNRHVDYDPKKIREGVKRALWKRPVLEEQVDEMMVRIARRVESLGQREVRSETIGEIVMEELEKLDQVAYVRFASVYRQFKDVGQFLKEIGTLREKRREG